MTRMAREAEALLEALHDSLPRTETARADDSPNTSDEEAIDAAHPLKTGRHDLYAYAMKLVGARHAKGDLVDLVNWLLYERAKLLNEAGAKPCVAHDCKDANAGEYALCPVHLGVLIDALKAGAGRPTATAPCEHRGAKIEQRWMPGLARVERIVWCAECGAFSQQRYGEPMQWELPRAGSGRESGSS